MSYAIWLAAAGTVLYILAGYPFLLWASKRTRRQLILKDAGFEPTVSVILAVYNGGSQHRNKLESLLGLDYPAELRPLTGALNAQETARALELTWDYLEELGTGIDRSDVNTWDATPSTVHERWDPAVGRDSGTQATHDHDLGT